MDTIVKGSAEIRSLLDSAIKKYMREKTFHKVAPDCSDFTLCASGLAGYLFERTGYLMKQTQVQIDFSQVNKSQL